MGLDLSGWDLGGNLDFSLGDTTSTGLPDYSVGDGQPGNVIDVPRSDGITVSGVLDAVTTGADKLFQLGSKIYSLQDAAENAKFARTMQQQRMTLAQAQMAGALDVERARVDANTQLGKLEAQRALADAQVRVSSSASTSRIGGGLNLSSVVPFALLGLLVWKVAKK